MGLRYPPSVMGRNKQACKQCTAWSLAHSRSSGFCGLGKFSVSESVFVHNCKTPTGTGRNLFWSTLAYLSQQPGTLLWAYHGHSTNTSKGLVNLLLLQGEESLSDSTMALGLEFRFPDSQSGGGYIRCGSHSKCPLPHKRPRNV